MYGNAKYPRLVLYISRDRGKGEFSAVDSQRILIDVIVIAKLEYLNKLELSKYLKYPNF